MNWEERFWVKVTRTTGCWEWQGTIGSKGYGFFKLNRKNQYAHRISYELAYGPIPKGKLVCHRCDNPRCVKPKHLFLGTHKDNLQDMVNKGRSNYGSRNGRARLNEGMVASIRNSPLTNGQEAYWWGVTEVLISRIRTRGWKNVKQCNHQHMKQ